MSRTLLDLYESTAEDFAFGLGELVIEHEQPTPYVQIFYQGWSREKLEAVRQLFMAGITLVSIKQPTGAYSVLIGTHQKASIATDETGSRRVLRAPAWTARLEHVDAEVLHGFENQRSKQRGFLLLLQTAEWEFLTAVTEPGGRTSVNPLSPFSTPMPHIPL